MNVTGRSRVVHSQALSHPSSRNPEPSGSPNGWRKRKRLAWWTFVAVAVAGIVVVGLLTRNAWAPPVRDTIAAIQQRLAGDPAMHSDETGHETDASGVASPHDANMIALSEKGNKNVGLSLMTVETRDFHKTVSVPAMVVEQASRTRITISAPMTGIVTRIHVIRGEAVRPGDPLFDLRLTHEDLVQKQSDLLREVEQLDVVRREVARLDQVSASGAIAGKRVLEQQYEQGKLEAAILADKQALVLHGLTQEQIDAIVNDRRLLQDVTITAPAAESESGHEHDDLFQVAEVAVTKGEQVTVGVPLATLSDHCELYIEGQAFEQDAKALNEAANRGVKVTAVVDEDGSAGREIADLEILYVENAVDRDSRALKFYVRLPNELARNEVKNGHRFIGWRYRPGQRVQLLVPVQTWENRIVLPVEAVVQEGPDWFVFQKHGEHFDRTAVHVEYRDRRWAVIDNDGTLFPGDTVVASGAYQLHLALKNKSGGGIDPHAGHNH